MAYCTNCGKVNETEDVFCSRCGMRLWDGQSSSPVIAQCPAWQPSPKRKNEGLWVIFVIVILFVVVNIAVPYLLYMMVMGFDYGMGFDDGSEEIPYANIMTSETGSPHQEKVLFMDVSSPMRYEDILISLIINGSENLAPVHPGDIFIGTGQSSGYFVEYVDLAMDLKLGVGDYFLITNPPNVSGAEVYVSLALLYGSSHIAIASTYWYCL